MAGFGSVEPGKGAAEGPSDYSWGAGLVPPTVDSGESAGSRTGAGGGAGAVGRGRSAYEQLRAMRMTDVDNPEASEADVFKVDVSQTSVSPEDGSYVAGTLRAGATKAVTEKKLMGDLVTGQFEKVDPGKFNVRRVRWGNDGDGGGVVHHSDGLQDGEGDLWREGLPPNPVG